MPFEAVNITSYSYSSFATCVSTACIIVVLCFTTYTRYICEMCRIIVNVQHLVKVSVASSKSIQECLSWRVSKVFHLAVGRISYTRWVIVACM